MRIHLAAIPLERDEGEYAYAGQLLLQGIPPYQLAWNMKLPGTYVVHAAIMAVFGQTIVGIHLGLLAVNAATIVLIFLLGRRFFGAMGGVAAAAAYALLSVTPGVLGTASHATHFVVLPAVAGTLLLLRQRARPFWAGILYGLAFVMKQHGACFVAFGGAYLIWHGLRAKNRRAFAAAVAVYVTGAALPFGITCLLLWRAGVFANFWFWTFTYARNYAALLPWWMGVRLFQFNIQEVVLSAPAVWACAAFGFAAVWAKRDWRVHAVAVTAFLLFSFLGTVPGFYFRQHYFILILPAAAILAGAAAVARPRLTVPIFAAALLFTVYQRRIFFFESDPSAAVRRLWGTVSPFSKAKLAGDWLRQHAAPSEQIAVLGSEPEIYFYANRHAATGYLYMYPLMEPQPYASRMQSDLVHQIEESQPQFIVFVNSTGSWGRGQSSPVRVLDWWPGYRDAYYSLAAWVYVHEPDSYLAIYHRKPPAL